MRGEQRELTFRFLAEPTDVNYGGSVAEPAQQTVRVQFTNPTARYGNGEGAICYGGEEELAIHHAACSRAKLT